MDLEISVKKLPYRKQENAVFQTPNLHLKVIDLLEFRQYELRTYIEEPKLEYILSKHATATLDELSTT